MKGKALALLSGGLDSTLAVKMVKDMGLEVEAVHFTTPFCNCDDCSVNEAGEKFGIKVHHVYLGDEFLRVVEDPPHGRGSNMNICIDCRILMLKKAKELAKEIGADFFVTGEVLGQRPMSQYRSAMHLIEEEAGVEGLVLRPLSGGLMEKTRMEEEGIVDRTSLLEISGRRRLPQIELAEKLGVYDYPCPSGGCLLTDPEYAARLREHLSVDGHLTVQSALLLRLGRHFRIGKSRIGVGRNEVENNALSGIASRIGVSLEVEGHNGPTTLVVEATEEAIAKAAALTVRYSDAPKDGPVWVSVTTGGEINRIKAEAMKDEIESLRIRGKVEKKSKK